MTLGTVLKEARLRGKLSLRDVERKTMTISNGYLSLLESDSVKSPSPNHLHALAEVYGVSYSLLLELAGYAVPAAASMSLPEGILGDVEDLSVDEWSEVRRFVGYLRSTRSDER